jgi:hypothetical protein
MGILSYFVVLLIDVFVIIAVWCHAKKGQVHEATRKRLDWPPHYASNVRLQTTSFDSLPHYKNIPKSRVRDAVDKTSTLPELAHNSAVETLR